MTPVCHFPYGMGPYNRGEVVQKYHQNQPTGMHWKIKRVIFPPGKEPDPNNSGDEGDFGMHIKLAALKKVCV